MPPNERMELTTKSITPFAFAKGASLVSGSASMAGHNE
jgi:hypothetical protein